jgi:carbon-monoxide dehydrogenase medium subunit
MENFVFHTPKTVADAVSTRKGTSGGKFLAGGQSLIPVLKLDLAQPSDLVSLAGLKKELSYIKVEGDELVIGALTTHAEVEASELVKKTIPSLSVLASGIGDAQVRNRGTIGGSVAHADPAADYPSAILALDATIKTDRRALKADDFFKAMFETALEDGELITEVRFKKPEKAGYMKFNNPASKYAIVGVYVAKYGPNVRVGVTGAGTVAFRLPDFEAALAKSFDPKVLDGIKVSEDDLVNERDAKADYRAQMITVFAKRAVEAAH